MIADMIAGALLLAAFGCIIALVLRHRFGTHLGALEAELRKPCPAQSPRSDLPAKWSSPLTCRASFILTPIPPPPPHPPPPPPPPPAPPARTGGLEVMLLGASRSRG